MSLKTKLMLGFLIPAAMWLVVGIWTSVRMRSLGSEVEEMLQDNARSIHYAGQMIEAVERIDSAILLKIGGDETVYRQIFDDAYGTFITVEKLAEGNITVAGEKELLDTIRSSQELFFSKVNHLIDNPGIDKYNLEIYPEFSRLRHYIQRLGTINSESMHATAAGVVDSARRAALPGELVALAAVFFSLAFTWLIQVFVITPLRKIVAVVSEWSPDEKIKLPQIETGDELQELAEGLERLNQRHKPGN